MIASPAAPQAMGSYPNQQQRQPQQGQLYPGQQLQAFQQHQQGWKLYSFRASYFSMACFLPRGFLAKEGAN